MRLTHYITESSGEMSLVTILNMLVNNSLPYLKELEREFKGYKKGSMFFLSGRTNNKDVFKRKIRKNRSPKDMPEDAHESLDDGFYDEFGVHYRSNAVFVTGNFNTADSYGDNVYMIFPIGQYSYAWSNQVQDLYSDTDDGNNFVEKYELTWDEEEDLESDVREGLQEDWQDRFGDPDSEGRWEYTNGGDDDEPEDTIGNQGESLEDFEERISDDEYTTYNENFEWIPLYEMDDYIDDEYDDKYREKLEIIISDWNDGVKERVVEIVSGYQEGNLKKAIQSGNEIMLHGKEYIAINYETYEPVLRMWFRDHTLKDIAKYNKMLKSDQRKEAIVKLEAWYKSMGKRMPRQLNLFDKM